MTPTRTITSLFFAAVVTAALTGCSTPTYSAITGQTVTAPKPRAVAPRVARLIDSLDRTPNTTVFEQELPGNRLVLCISTRGAHMDVSITCDWAHAHTRGAEPADG